MENRPACNGREGVTVHQREWCWPGYTLCWGRKSGRARLVDMEGRIAHEWAFGDSIWHHTDMLDNGNLLVLANDRGGYGPKSNIERTILELDWHSGLVWSDPVHAHHDARRLANGNTLLVGHDRAQYEQISPHVLIYDYLQEITPGNEVVWEWHAAPHVNELRALVDVVHREWTGDWPHINTVESLPDTPLGRRDTRFREGNVLVSPRHLHCIFVVDRDSGKIVWAWGPGNILGQHQPTMLENGNILLFDNGRGNAPGEDRDYSRVIEIEPVSGSIVWEYKTDPPRAFFSPVGSGQQRLPNGNTLICAMNWSETGRIFEVTPEGAIVWEFWDPEHHPFYRAKRYSLDLVTPLLDR